LASKEQSHVEAARDVGLAPVRFCCRGRRLASVSGTGYPPESA
jgi:hypothetical protein